jgi:tetratricopeptide (TPR) repeat protein
MKGGLRAAFLFSLFVLSVLASGKYYQYVLGVLRVAVFSTFGVWLWRRGRDAMDVPLYALAVGGFSVLSLGHAFSSVYGWVSFQHALNICLAGAFLCVGILRFGDRSTSSAPAQFVLVVAALAAIEIVVASSQRATVGTTRPHGTFSNPMFLSEFLAIAALFFASRLLGEWGKSGRRRIAWGAGAVFFLAGALSLTGSRGVVVALVPALVVLTISHFGIARGGKVFLFTLPGLILLGWHSISRFFGPEAYNYGRWVFWRSAFRVFGSYPFGVGLGGYKYHWFATQEPFPEAFRHFAKYPVTPHNEYLEVLTGLGLPGFALFLIVLALPLWYAARGWKKVPDDRRWICAGALSGLVLSGTNALFNFNFHEFGIVFTDTLLLGILWTSLPESVSGKRVEVSPFFSRAIAFLALLLGVVSASLLGGAAALGRGEALVLAGEFRPAEKSFRLASFLDPARATIPEALAALDHRRFVLAVGKKDPAAVDLLNSSILWLERARDLCPLEQGYHYRLAGLFLEKYRLGGDPRDLESVLASTREILKINPFGVEAHWNLSQAYQHLGRTSDAVEALRSAVSVEPNFCRGYAKLAELTRGTDKLQSLGWEARAEKCREAARGRMLEENERWLVEEPEPISKTAVGRTEDGEPDSPSGFSPSR